MDSLVIISCAIKDAAYAGIAGGNVFYDVLRRCGIGYHGKGA